MLELAEGSSNTEMFWARFAWDGYGSTRAELLWRGSGGTRRGNDRCAMPHAWIATNF